MALIKKLWQCSVLSCTLRVAVPSPPSHPGRERVRLHVRIPSIFQLVCHTLFSISVFSCYSRSVEARNCRSDRRETGTKIIQIRKTENGIEYQIRTPVTIFCKNRKLNAKIRKIRKLQWTPKPKNRNFLAQKPKNQSNLINLLTYQINKLRRLKIFLLKGEKSLSAEMEIVFT